MTKLNYSLCGIFACVTVIAIPLARKATLLAQQDVARQEPAPIQSLSVRIVTQEFPLAGFPTVLPLGVPAGQVWFDVGPRAWQLTAPTNHGGAPFSRKSVDEFLVCGPPAGCGGLTRADLFELRLEKKGLGGFTGAEDGPDGGWMPKEITLFIDGNPLVGPIRVLPDLEQLDKSHPAWRHLLLPTADTKRRFVLGLRTTPNSHASTHLDEQISGITTIFKKNGISGWQSGPLPDDPVLQATVEGSLDAPPSPGTDGFVSLDLRVSSVTIDGITTPVNSPTDADGVRHTRYIRVEYIHGDDSRYTGWKVGTQFRITGTVKWDTDRDGFYEIHSSKPADVIVLH